MKKTILFLAVLLCTIPAFAQDVYIPDEPKDVLSSQDIQQNLSKATLSVYRGKLVCEWDSKAFDTPFGKLSIRYWGCEFKKVFTCTATVIDREEDEYIGLSAGHCIIWADEDNYYVGTDVGPKPVLHKVRIVKAEHDDRYDFAIFSFHSFKELGVVKANVKDGIPALGTKVLNINFSLGIGKQYNRGEVISEALNGEPMGDDEQRYLVSVGVGPGASGSAIVSTETGEIIGLAEFIFPGTQMATGVIPTGSRLADFMDDDSAGIKPKPAPKDDSEDKSEENPNTKKTNKSSLLMLLLKWFFILSPI